MKYWPTIFIKRDVDGYHVTLKTMSVEGEIKEPVEGTFPTIAQARAWRAAMIRDHHGVRRYLLKKRPYMLINVERDFKIKLSVIAQSWNGAVVTRIMIERTGLRRVAQDSFSTQSYTLEGAVEAAVDNLHFYWRNLDVSEEEKQQLIEDVRFVVLGKTRLHVEAGNASASQTTF